MPSIIALDVGDVRVGVARAHTIARIAEPLRTLTRQDDFWQELDNILLAQEAELVVVGLPRNLDGNDTEQTKRVRAFADDLARQTKLPQVFQDEALTSRKAEQTLQTANKAYQKADIDALAAMYILDDYLASRRQG